jgi:hypothetical protein
LCRVFGLINFLNFAKIFQKSWEAKNKLKGSGKMKHLLMFSTNKGRSSGRFISFKGNGTLISKNDNPVVLELGCGKESILLV